MDTSNYIELLKECNRQKDKIINLTKPEYKTVYGENVKGIVFKEKFYTKTEYEEMVRQENDSYEKRIAKINEEVQKLIENDK